MRFTIFFLGKNNSFSLGVKVEFEEEGKPEYPEKNPRSRVEIDKSRPTCKAWESIPDRRGGRRDWRPLRQPDSLEGSSHPFTVRYITPHLNSPGRVSNEAGFLLDVSSCRVVTLEGHVDYPQSKPCKVLQK